MPAIDGARWVTASHNSSTPIVSCYGNGDFGCHASGHGSQKTKLLAPATVAATAPDSSEQEEGFCFNCHDTGGPAGTNLEGEFAKGTNTATQTYHHPVTDSEQSGGRAVECVDCHNPHEVTSGNTLLGVTGVNLAGGAVSDPAEYEACIKCHGDNFLAGRDIDGDGTADASNKRLDFALNASAFHPVSQAGRNTSTALRTNLLAV